ncbi:hypothetical protein V6N12_032220 [Hibiscus sabdariffa]|uniref:RNase H type-1 domain-containing protein n=1 Tax=Hibiscus sabdariffa TaxID=183260 RepID=A0ABR2CC10_9ROSI
MVYGYDRRLGHCSVLMAELWAAHDIFLAVWDLGLRQVQMKTDNLEVVRILQGSSDALDGCSLVDAILMILARQWIVSNTHITRDQNLVADRLSRYVGILQLALRSLILFQMR